MVSGDIPDMTQCMYPFPEPRFVNPIGSSDRPSEIFLQYPEEIMGVSYGNLFKKHPAWKIGFWDIFFRISPDEQRTLERIFQESFSQIEKVGVNLRVVPEIQFEVISIQIPESSSGCRHFLIHNGFQRNLNLLYCVKSEKSKLPIKHICIKNFFKRGSWKKCIVRFLERLKISAQSEISYMLQIPFRLVGVLDFESPIGKQLKLLFEGQTGFRKSHAVKTFDFG